MAYEATLSKPRDLIIEGVKQSLPWFINLISLGKAHSLIQSKLNTYYNIKESNNV